MKSKKCRFVQVFYIEGSTGMSDYVSTWVAFASISKDLVLAKFLEYQEYLLTEPKPPAPFPALKRWAMRSPDLQMGRLYDPNAFSGVAYIVESMQVCIIGDL